MEKIILASQSPRRKQLLEWAEVNFEIIVRETEETFPESLPIPEVPVYIARQKALSVKSAAGEGRIILAADTVVVLNNRIIGKPRDRRDALQILSALSGNHHEVITGVVILKDDKEVAFSQITDVKFHALTTDQLTFYVDKYKPYDKAGAYAIQEWIGVVGIETISGDFYNVMGLPVSRVVRELNLLMNEE